MAAANTPFQIGGERVKPGQRSTVDLQIPELYTHTPMVMPVHVINGKREGPVTFICGALHGDELTGVAVVHRLMRQKLLSNIRGTLLLVPIVNVYGFIHQSRYLPDRRDLNRCFPGYESGSLAARLANLFMEEIVSRATHGIDLHSGAIHRTNLPQIRANLDHEESFQMAKAFDAPVILHSRLRDGSLREAVNEQGLPIILYEAGEALRLDEYSVRVGVRGIINVLRSLDMLPKSRKKIIKAREPFLSRESRWVRAPKSGMVFLTTALGRYVEAGHRLGEIVDPFSHHSTDIRAENSGIVIGRTQIPLTNEGDAVVHIAESDNAVPVKMIDDEFVAGEPGHSEIFP